MRNPIFPVYHNGEKLGEYPTLPAIYCFINIVNNKKYVGQTDNFQRRTMQHLRDLRAGRDFCSLFQKAWIKHGEENFQIIILEFCKKKN